MTLEEFSNEFDILYNSIMSNQAPGLDEYEKSVFLTNAQNDILQAYFNPRENKVQEGFDDSRKRQMDFSTVMRTVTLKRDKARTKFDPRSLSYRIPKDLYLFVNETCADKNNRYIVTPLSYDKYDQLMTKPYQYPIKRNIWRLIIDFNQPSHAEEKVLLEGNSVGYLTIENSTDKEVLFIIKKASSEDISSAGAEGITNVGIKPTIEEVNNTVTITCKIFSNTGLSTANYIRQFLNKGGDKYNEELYKYIGDFKSEGFSWMPVTNPDNVIGKSLIAPPCDSPNIELIGRYDEDTLTYTIRYIRRPRPIVLVDLQNDLSVQGVNTKSECELNPSLHREVLQRAIELAKAAYTGDLNSQIALGHSSQTDIGMVSQSR